ncbi:MAG: hypothetical protein V3T70_10275, partial [Phycisphaerae bacterium]
MGDCTCNSTLDECPARLSVSGQGNHRHVSVAVNLAQPLVDRLFTVAWVGQQADAIQDPIKQSLLSITDNFESPFDPPEQAAPANQPGDIDPSAGMGAQLAAFGWTSELRPPAERGLIFDAPLAPGIQQIKDCAPFCDLRPTQWLPCLAMSNNHFVIVWAEAELPNDLPPFDIAMQLYDTSANPIGPVVIVNQPVQQLETTETSPAVAFDGTNIAVSWVGSEPDNCTGPFRIYGRRFTWDPNSPNAPVPQGDQFIVDEQAGFGVPNAIEANPTVALTLSNSQPGRFIIAWNTEPVGVSELEVHARYFASNGTPRGREFRLHVVGDPLDGFDRRIADSAQHTIQYGIDERVVASFTTRDSNFVEPTTVNFTILPADHAETLCGQLSCLRGDTNGDGLIDGDDIQDFVDAMVGLQSFDDPNACAFEAPDVNIICRYDINADCDVTPDDLPGFVMLLLGGTIEAANNDCNTNGTPDAEDVLDDPSIDCNVNFIPDACDLAGGTGVDVNTNGVLDACDPDCNGNGVLDVLDIDNGTSGDCDTNGIPDDCQPDCNTNGVFDACDAAGGTSLDC